MVALGSRVAISDASQGILERASGSIATFTTSIIKWEIIVNQNWQPIFDPLHPIMAVVSNYMSGGCHQYKHQRFPHTRYSSVSIHVSSPFKHKTKF